MNDDGQNVVEIKLVGYAALVEQYGLDVIPNWHKSMIAASGTHRVESTGGIVTEIYASIYWPGDMPGDQLRAK